MTVANTNVSSSYNANGETREWNLGFAYNSTLSGLSIVVKHSDGTSTTVTSNYELDGTVLTYPTVESELDPLPVGDVITITRVTPLTQNINLTQQGPLDAETLESGYDKLTMEVQEIKKITSDNIENINIVAQNISNVNAVASNGTNINAVNANKTNIDTVATNIDAINAAPTQASNAATSASNSQIWAEGTDEQVEALGGEHSAKEWAELAEQTVPTKVSQLQNDSGYITSSAISGMQTTSNLVTSVSSSSTDSQYPSAKLFYDTCGDIETLINAL